MDHPRDQLEALFEAYVERKKEEMRAAGIHDSTVTADQLKDLAKRGDLPIKVIKGGK